MRVTDRGGEASGGDALRGRVAVVAGATRGAGRGIAVALGEAGATVYCTGRSTKGRSAMEGRPESIEETAALVDAAGGTGVPFRADHLVEEEVVDLFDTVRRDQGRLDILVNDIWGGDPHTEWETPFWESDLQKMLGLMRTGIETHVITARHALPLMLETNGGLVVEVTDGDSGVFRGNVAYDLVKSQVVRLAFVLSESVKDKGVTALAVTPGFLRSEAVLDHFGVAETNWRDAIEKDPPFAHSETPLFVGRCIAALAQDPHVAKKRGRVYASCTLAHEYGVQDADGSRPDWGAFARGRAREAYRPLDDGFYAYWEGFERWFAAFEDA